MIKIALTGATGNMGKETLIQLMKLPNVTVKILTLATTKDKAILRKWKPLYKAKLETVIGDISDFECVKKFISGCDYVLNLAAVIPPHSDKNPINAKKCNLIGVQNIVKAIEKTAPQPKLIHISSVAVYGNRNYKHPWGRVGDPLLPSVYDVYASLKLHGERHVLDSNIKYWSILRQTAMLHENMLSDNLRDGLMFHTCFNSPLEWITARDSGRLIASILQKDIINKIPFFWKKVYNIGGSDENRCTGFDTFDDGFRIIGGSAKTFLNPNWHALRNFHGMWFYDGDVLENIFHYQKETVKDYWQEILRLHPYFKIAKILPCSLIKTIAVKRLLQDKNSPYRWIKDNDAGKIRAYFGNYDNIGLFSDWNQFPLLKNGNLPCENIDYEKLRDIDSVQKHELLSHGYDETKSDSELCLFDMQQVAKFRGGKCLSPFMVKGDLYTKLLWQCHDGHRFYASPYTILKAGHWCIECTKLNVWDYDKLSKKVPFYAQVWYDSHALKENTTYYFDNQYNAQYKVFGDNL